MGLCVGRVYVDRLIEQGDRRWIGATGIDVDPPALQKIFVRRVTFRRFTLHLLRHGASEPIGQNRNNRLSYFILDREDIFELPVIPFGPDMGAAFGFDHLHGDPHPAARLADASLDDNAGAQYPADVLNLDGLSFVVKRRISRDDMQLTKTTEFGNDVFGDAV